MSNNKFKVVYPDVFISTSTGNLYDFTSKNSSRTDPKTSQYGGIEIVPWGKDNLQPYHDRQLLAENDIKQSIIDQLVNINSGQGFFFYEDKVENGKEIKHIITDPELEDWIEEWALEEFFSETLEDLEEFENTFVEFILSRDAKKVASMQSMNLVDCRLTPVKNKQFNPSILAVADWLDKHHLSANNIEQVQLLNRRSPASELGRYYKSALHLKHSKSGQPYYNVPKWHGTKDWTENANIIPKFHLQGLKGGYMLRYHIKIPVSYFAKAGTEDEREKLKTDIQERLDEVLSGAENAQKAFFSYIEGIGQSSTEWKIEKIETDLKDESYLKLHDHASKVHARGHGLNPILAGIETSGSLSSGSEILNLINLHVAYKTPRRRRLAMQPINLVKNFNFPEKKNIKIGVRDKELTTLDKNPKGTENVAA